MSWLDSFLTSGYKSIAIAGVIVAQEQTMNFVSGFTSADDPVNGFTNLTPVGAGAPTGTGVALVSGGNFVGAAGKIDLSSSTYVTNVLGLANGGVGSTGTVGQVFASTGTGSGANGWASITGDMNVVGTTAGQVNLTVATLTGGAGGVSMAASNYIFTAAAVPVFKQTVATGGAGTTMTWRSQAAFPTSAGAGGGFHFITGKQDGAGANGIVTFGFETVVGSTTTDYLTISSVSGQSIISSINGGLKLVCASTSTWDTQGTGMAYSMPSGANFTIGNRNTGEQSWGWNVANAGALSMVASKSATSVTLGITAQNTTTNGIDLVLSGQANSNVGSGNGGGINLTMGTSTAGSAGKLKLTNMGTLATSGTAFSGGFAVPVTVKGVPLLVDGVSILLLACTP